MMSKLKGWITTALNTTVGSNPSRELKMMSKLLVVACAAVAVSAEADAGVYGYAPALLNAYPNWPGVSTPYSQSTCFGCRPGYAYGKRSADAEAEADPALLYGAYGYAGLPYAYGAYPYAYGLPTAAYGLAGEVAAPTASGYLNLYGKRSADAEADPALLYGAYPGAYAYGAYPYAYGYRGFAGVAAHPGVATSFVARSPQGLGKRSADADPALLYGAYGIAPYVTGSTYGYGPSGYTVAQEHPGFSSSYQSVSRLH